MTARRLLVAALAAAAAAACAPQPKTPPATEASARPFVRSNVLAEDHAGSAACAPCHEAVATRWAAAAMKRMTRNDGPGVARAPFDGRIFRFKDDTARLFEKDGTRFVEIDSKAFGRSLHAVTRIVGGRVREDFVGVQVDAAGTRSEKEQILPVTHVLRTGELRYKGYTVMSKERPGLRAGPVWEKTCIFCHNTVPYLDTVLGALSKGELYQGEHVDALLPADRRRPFRVTDAPALSRALGDELARIGAPRAASATLPKAISALRKAFDGKDLLEVGIGCEACHLGAKEHVADPRVRTSFAPRSPFVAAPFAPDAPEAEVRACARCHQVLFSQYAHTWEGGLRATSPGGANINSGEARDLLLGKCASRIRCSTCHDVHGDRPARRDDGVCTSCHAEKAGLAAQRAHSGHDPAREGGRCVACHMPEKNLTLDGRLGVYHRIGSPTDAAKEKDRPDECALCHGDWSAERLAEASQKLFGKRRTREALVELYGDPGADVLRATALRGLPHEQATAIAKLGERKDRAAIPLVAASMTHPIPLVRYFARTALERMLGEPCPVDLHADDRAVGEATAAWLGKHGVAFSPSTRPSLPAAGDDGE